MTTTEDRKSEADSAARAGRSDMKLEVLVIPVSDVDRAKEFYTRLGWRLDADLGGAEFRLVQITPPGSGCSIQFGTNLIAAEPGSAQGLLLAVADVEAARAELVSRGVEVMPAFHCANSGACRFRDGAGRYERVTGPAPEHATYSTFATFTDPDGNGWVLQEVTQRLPGRIDPGAGTGYSSVNDLAGALRRASAAHGEHEQRIGKADPDWPDWYAAYMVAEQAGTELPT
jgi:catechol 2,3-dioxygenase-like lactoylglutathione lyase family enzyme